MLVVQILDSQTYKRWVFTFEGSNSLHAIDVFRKYTLCVKCHIQLTEKVSLVGGGVQLFLIVYLIHEDCIFMLQIRNKTCESIKKLSVYFTSSNLKWAKTEYAIVL